MYLIAFPLLIIPFVLYNMIAFLLGLDLNTTVFTVSLLSGKSMPISAGDILVLIGVFLLYIEILKAARLSAKAIIDHMLSLALFVGMMAEFITVQRAATSTFLILLALSFVDVIGGLTIPNRTARRAIEIEGVDRPSPG
jgi:hypothetical protein